MKRVLLSLALIVLVVCIAVAGCAKPAAAPVPGPAPEAPKTLDIGIATPLTGSYSFLGTQIQNAALLAIDDQNKQGGVTIGGQKYMLNSIIRDTKQDLVLGKSIAEELIFDKGVKVIIGPFISDAIGAQSVTEPNKVIAFLPQVTIPGMSGPEKPYTFFFGPVPEQMYVSPVAYVQKTYPEAKTVVSMAPDIPTLPAFLAAINTIFPQYGLQWLGVEKFPVNTKDLTAIVTRALAKNPDMADICCTGGMAGLGSLSIKQLRLAGFTGPIIMPMSPSRVEAETVVPREYLTKVVVGYPDMNSPLVSEAYRDVYNAAKEKYQVDPHIYLFQVYNPVRAFFKFLDGQATMDSTAWMEGFAKYHWQGIYGFENYWVGKKVWGIDRRVFTCPWVSEYTDGKLVTEFTAPIPYDMFVEK
jgi:branched-chain amino acid transport system substrate-binding protein